MRKRETLPRDEFFQIVADLDCGEELVGELNGWQGGATCAVVEYSVDSLGRIDSMSSPVPA